MWENRRETIYSQLPKYTEVEGFGARNNTFQLILWCNDKCKLLRMIEDQIVRILDMIILLRDKVNPNLIVYSVDNALLGFGKMHLKKVAHHNFGFTS